MSLLATALLIWLVGLPGAILLFAFALSLVDRGRSAIRNASLLSTPACSGARRRSGTFRRTTLRRTGASHQRG